MLTLIVENQELFDEDNQAFIYVDGFCLDLEHSLLALSKWESDFQKPFLSTHDKSDEETLAYISAMVLTKNPPVNFLKNLSAWHLDQVNEYINSPQSATTFGMMPQHKAKGEVITSELIYYWMVAFNIPFVCETWHLNRLFSLIRICNIKNSKPQKMSKADIVARNRELNAQRRAQLGTNG